MFEVLLYNVLLTVIKPQIIAQNMRCVQDPVVQSIVSLTSSLVVEMLTVLVSIISKSQVFLVKKCE